MVGWCMGKSAMPNYAQRSKSRPAFLQRVVGLRERKRSVSRPAEAGLHVLAEKPAIIGLAALEHPEASVTATGEAGSKTPAGPPQRRKRREQERQEPLTLAAY